MPKDRSESQSWLDKPLLPNFKITWEVALIVLLLLAALLTRFYGLGDRVISHDETTHVLFSWNLEQGYGYGHDPLSHGPLQFHLLALSYFLFGDNDFSARLPHAIFSVATVLFAWWGFRRYLGRVGAVVAGFLMLISPYMLYYGRYARNEAFVALFGLVMLWGILRYLDRGENKYLYIITASLALHFTSKETAFIYAAQALIFLGLLFLARIFRQQWKEGNARVIFFVSLLTGALLLMLAMGAQVVGGAGGAGTVSTGEVVEPVVAGAEQAAVVTGGLTPAAIILAILGVVAVVAALVFLVRGYSLQRLRAERSFGLMALIFSLALPNLAAFPLKVVAPQLSYTALRNTFSSMSFTNLFSSPDLQTLVLVVVVVVVMFLLSAAVGMLWNTRQWAINLAIFFAVFIPLFTTFFTFSLGFFTGLVGSLGYWIEQQAVQRGSQPWFYYWAVQIPVYEFLPALGTLAAGVIGLRLWSKQDTEELPAEDPQRKLQPAESRRMALVLLVFWAATSLAAYSIAGEKMPWLTVHITLPLILIAGWAIGWMIQHVNWAKVFSPRGLAIAGSMAVALLSFVDLLSVILGTHYPFQGNELFQLEDTYRFIFTFLVFAGSLVLIGWLTVREEWSVRLSQRVLALIAVAGLAALTARSAFRAAYLHYDLATEYLVYAHMAPGPKLMMDQLEDLSERLTDGLYIKVAYDNETNYPLWWYLRNYPNKVYYDVNPSMGLREDPVIIVGDTNYSKVEAIVRDDYYMFEFARIWWPNQDYWDFNRDNIGYTFTAETGLAASEMSSLDYIGRVWQKLISYIDTPEEREAMAEIWLNRDFSQYLELKGRDPDLAAWDPRRSMRMYVRKDVAAQIWDYGAPPFTIEDDAYAGKGIELSPDVVIGSEGDQVGQFNSPRGVAVAPDGSVYVADSLNHRIQHFDAEGQLIDSWGSSSELAADPTQGGAFAEPWGVAVSPDGRFVYVADTWNHRIQKFTSDGQFRAAWGSFGNSSDGGVLYGPRDVVVASDGNVLVSDTGNKRIVVYDSQGNYLSQIGGSGFDPGHFEEPVGLAMDLDNNILYVADTWNQRIQTLAYADGVLNYVSSWDVDAWFGQSLENKPYLAYENGRVYVSDPEASRVLVFDTSGNLLEYFGGLDQSAASIGLAQGVAADGQGGVWLTDSLNAQLMHFSVGQ